MVELTIMLGFDAGEGAMVTGRMLSKTFARAGLNVLVYPEYPSLIRGGHNAVQIRVSDEKDMYSPTYRVDLLLASNVKGIFYHSANLKKGGVIVCDESINVSEENIPSIGKKQEGVQLAKIPFKKILKTLNAQDKMLNVLMVGAVLGLIEKEEGEFINTFKDAIKEEFGRKGKDIVNLNIKVAEEGYKHAKDLGARITKIPRGKKKDSIVITGNESAALGAVNAGMKFYAAYPMTPASSLLHHLAKIERKADIIVKHTEDEISAINYAVGAAYAGVRAMTGTSGGGFALMTETLGMAALAETPLVVYLAQRVGPSTGMPTWTEQADLKFALYASQGDFLRAIIAPSDAEESFYLMTDAFNIAEKYQIPVIVITDKFLAESAFSIQRFDIGKVKIHRGKIADENTLKELKPNERFERYKITEDGVSERTFPGMKNGMHVATSYEHDETSFTTESFEIRAKMVEKRANKKEFLEKELSLPKVYGKEDAEITLLTWGSQKLPALDAMERLKSIGIEANVVVYTFLFPLNEKRHAEFLSKFKHIMMVENNSTAQFAGVLREYVGFVPDAYALRYDGRPHFGEKLADAVVKWKASGFRKGARFILNEKEDVEYYYPYKYSI